jgi:hypothetical protein
MEYILDWTYLGDRLQNYYSQYENLINSYKEKLFRFVTD